MQSNTQRFGCDPAGAHAPAQPFKRLGLRVLGGVALAAGFIAGLLGLVR